MAVSQMRKVQIFTHKSHRESLIKDLHDMEIIHINDLNESGESTEETIQDTEIKAIRNIQNDLLNLRSAINYLASYEPKKGFIAGMLGGGKPTLSPEEYKQISIEAESNEWRNICDECQSMQDQISRLAGRESRLIAEKENLSLWSGLDASIESIRDTEKTAIRIGIIPLNTYDLLVAEIKRLNLDVALETVGNTRTDINIVIIFLKSEEQSISSLLSQYGFSPVSLPINTGKISDQIKRIDEEIYSISLLRKEIAEKSEKLSLYRSKLMAIYDYMSEVLNREEIKRSFLHTDYTLMVDGWVRKDDVNKLKDELIKKYDEIEIIVSEPSADDEPPVDLENRLPADPYQMVTRLYGIPRYREIDPTPLLAPFLTIGFAICLTDAGYGIIVALISLFAMRKTSGGNKNLFRILFIAGLTTLLVGALTGGWFGISGDKLPSFLLKIRLLDPNVKQLTFLSLIVAFGYIQVLFGFIVKMYISFKERDWISAFCDQLTWVLCMILVPIFILMRRSDAPSFISSIVLIIILLCAFVILIFSGREIKNPAGRIGTGFFELYSRVTGTFGDTLSYMRLFALGLATGIIASSINVIAGMLWTNPVGKIGAVAVLLFGHPFNIVINSLGGFIHSTRLQFVEFFTKFYEGGGKEFRPFRRRHEYITVLGLDKAGSVKQVTR